MHAFKKKSTDVIHVCLHAYMHTCALTSGVQSVFDAYICIYIVCVRVCVCACVCVCVCVCVCALCVCIVKMFPITESGLSIFHFSFFFWYFAHLHRPLKKFKESYIYIHTLRRKEFLHSDRSLFFPFFDSLCADLF